MNRAFCLTLTEDSKEKFDNALSDFLCWIDGFKAAGGTYSPHSENTLRDLRDAIGRAYDTISTTTKNERK